MRARGLVRTCATPAAVVLGTVLLSGTGQPVTANTYPRWQELASPPFAARSHALGVRVGPRVLVLGGLDRQGRTLRDGAAYDLRTGLWRHLRLPVTLTERDHAVAAAGSLFVSLPHAWWRYDVRDATWTRMRQLPRRVSAPSVFRSELYALSHGRVNVYSPQLTRWSRLPADPLRPVLRARSVVASRHGTAVSGYARERRVTDRWDGLRWRRRPATVPAESPAPPAATLRLDVGGRLFVVRGDRAWIRLP